MKFSSFLLFLFFTQLAHAWDWQDFKQEAAVPVTTDAKYVLYAGTGLTLGILLFEDAVSDPFQVKQARNQTLGDTSLYGDILGQLVMNTLYVGGMAIAGYYKDPKGYYRAIGMMKATAYSSGLTTILKYTAREPRPYNHHIKNSFPSGHTTTAFSFSGYVAAEHGWAWGAPALALATFVGYSRINDNRHWLHDVTAGATIGWVYGWGIAQYEKQKREEAEHHKKSEEASVTILPMVDTKTLGLALYSEF